MTSLSETKVSNIIIVTSDGKCFECDITVK